MKAHRKRLEQAEKHKPPAPPAPRDPEQAAFMTLLACRLYGRPWTEFKAGMENIRRTPPDDLSAPQRRIVDTVAATIKAADEKGIVFNGLADADFEKLFVPGLIAVTRCALYQALWHKCWRAEGGEDPFLPPDRDLSQSFDTRTGLASPPISQDRRQSEGLRAVREAAQFRENAILEGANSILDGQHAARLVAELFSIRPGLRRRRLKESDFDGGEP